MALISRKAIRARLQVLFGAIPLLQAAFAYKPHTFDGQSPIIYLTSSGTQPEWLTGKGLQNTIYLNAHICTLYASAQGETVTYYEQTAEDMLDDIEGAVRQVIQDNPTSAGHWMKIKYAGRSNADDPLVIEGDLYLHEIIPLVMEIAK